MTGARSTLTLPIQAEEAACFLVPHLLSAYAAGDLLFADAVIRCAAAVDVEGMPTVRRQKLLGAAVEALLSVAPKAPRSRPRERPLWLCRACSELVDLVSTRESLPLAGASPGGQTAYDRAAGILTARGIAGMTAGSVTKARADWKLHAHKP